MGERINFTIDARTKERIAESAKAQGLSVSSYIRMLVLKALEK